MHKFHIINRHGLRFTMFASNRRQACQELMRLLGKRSLPEYISIVPAV